MSTAALFMLALSWAVPCAGGPTSDRSAMATTTKAEAPSGDPSSRAVTRRNGGDESRRVGRGSDNDKSDGWLRTLGALAVVAALIFAARWFLRRWGAAGTTSLTGPMEVIAKASVAPHQQLLLVRLGKRLVLIGTGSGAMSTLAEVTDPAEVNELMQAVKSAKDGTFAGLLKRYAKGGASAKDTPVVQSEADKE